MKLNQWTIALAAAGVVSLGAIAQAEEAQNQVLTAVSSTTLSGYVDTSLIWRPGSAQNTTGAGAYTGGSKQDGFNLNVVQISLEKPLDPNDNWAAGYRFDMLAGEDAKAYKGNIGGANDFAIQNAYVNLRMPVAGSGLETKIGVFGNEVAGYESFDSWKNANYSRSYGYNLSPLTFTGIQTTYKPVDVLTLKAGVANTADSIINSRSSTGSANESRKTYFGGITLTAPESMGFLASSELYAGAVYGDGGLTTVNYSANTVSLSTKSQVNFYAGATIKTPVTGLSLGLAYDYAGKDQGAVAASAYFANAISGYVNYQITEKLKMSAREEYASCSGNNAVFASTLTVDYNLWGPNLITRLEGRWDHNLSGRVDASGSNGTGNLLGIGWDTQTGNYGVKNLYTLALNVIYRF